MSANPHFPADLIKFTQEILNGKLHLLYSECLWDISENSMRKLKLIFENSRSSRPEVFLGKSVLKFIGEHPCRTAISIKLLATLLKSHFGMGVLLLICCIFSEHLFLRAPLSGCF